MATLHKKLANGVLGTSAADAYAPSVYAMVKTIVLHNTDSAQKHATFYLGTTATPSASEQILRATLDGYETLEWSLGHMIVVDGTGSSGMKISGEAESADTVNFFIFGAEES
tara:strand:+ start:586 stop:921 length:336 start_codon:yes stop_codon:yes gene_type:complete